MSNLTEVFLVFLSAALGFLAGLWAARKLQTESDKNKCKQLRIGLKTAISHNNDLLAGLLDWVRDPGSTPYFNMDMVFLESTSAIKYELLKDVKLCEEIDSFRYELTHLSRKVDALFNLRFNPIFITQPIGENGTRLRGAHGLLQDSIRTHTAQLTPKIAPLIEKLG